MEEQKVTDHPWSITTGPIKVVRPPRAGYTIAEANTAGSFATFTYKSSVDDGKFIPNQYRVNPYIARCSKTTGGVLSNTWYAKSGNYEFRGSCSGYGLEKVLAPYLGSYSSPSPTYEPTLALQKAMANVNAAALQSLVELGELKETVKFLIRPLSSMRDFLESHSWKRVKEELLVYLKTGTYRGKTGKHAAQAASSTWLEIRYGLRPLLLSFIEVLELVYEKASPPFDPQHIYCAKGSVKEHEVESVTLAKRVFVGTGSGYVNYYADVVGKSTIRAYGSVQFRRLREMNPWEKLGLTPNHLLEAAWELTRLSFIVDMFYDIGSWISSLRFNPDVTILGNTVGVKIVDTVELKNFDSQFYTGVDVFETNPSFDNTSFIREGYSRSIQQQLGVPQFTAGDLMTLPQVIDVALIAMQNVKF